MVCLIIFSSRPMQGGDCQLTSRYGCANAPSHVIRRVGEKLAGQLLFFRRLLLWQLDFNSRQCAFDQI